MGELAEIGWALGIPLSLAVSAAGATLMSLNYFPQARFLVWSAPLPLVIADILWTVTTSFSIWGQVVISACVGCIVAVGTLEMLRLIEHHEKKYEAQINLFGISTRIVRAVYESLLHASLGRWR